MNRHQLRLQVLLRKHILRTPHAAAEDHKLASSVQELLELLLLLFAITSGLVAPEIVRG